MLLHPADEARSGRAPQTAFTLYKLPRFPALFKREPAISQRDGGGFAARRRRSPWIRVLSTRSPLALFRLAYRIRFRDGLRMKDHPIAPYDEVFNAMGTEDGQKVFVILVHPALSSNL
jgi:hypothetical protein